MPRCLLALSAAMAWAAVGCAAAPAELKVVPVTFETPERVVVQAEVADTDAARARGLMGRTALADDEGMLFVWSEVAERSFWMKDTLIALDLIAIRDGRVVSVQRMEPCETAECPLTTTPPADAALEVAAGVAARAAITPGTLVEAEPLR